MDELTGQGPLRFKPLYMERVWGGTGLNTYLDRELPSGNPIGESWEVVDRPEAQSVVEGGFLDGWSLNQALMEHGTFLMGPGWKKNRPFPVLVKWLDCQQRLSLQVHPPASVASELGGEPKTENWYVAATEPDASLIVGLKDGVSKEHFKEALHEERLEECVHKFDVQPGDSILVESGRLHAIDAGNLILEIQQNSDTTYRVYDWGRVGLDGQPRQLHIEESMQCIDFNDFEPTPQRESESVTSPKVLADCKEFRITRHNLLTGHEMSFEAGIQPRLLHIVEGQLQDKASGSVLVRGDNVLLPYSVSFDLVADKKSLVLVTDGFFEKTRQNS